MMKKRTLILIILLVSVLTACTARMPAGDDPTAQPNPEEENSFVLPDDIRVGTNGVPALRVYVTDDREIHEMDLEEYVCGVLAGEVKNDWPLEALKAQAILARTFVIKFITEKQSKYKGADISTDIEEAQAYDTAGINERIRQAVRETRGQIVCWQGSPIYAWFHAHAGGVTATAEEGLSYRKDAPYTQSINSPDSDQAPVDDAEWDTEFTAQQVIAAAADVGIKLSGDLKTAEPGVKGQSGRLKTIVIKGSEIPANEFRIAIGSTEMKSTLITAIRLEDDMLKIAGKGYGHGVGMSQWGAYALAKNGENAEDIINMYFKNVNIMQMWT